MSAIEGVFDDSEMRYVVNVHEGRHEVLLVLLHGYGKCAAELIDRFVTRAPALSLVALQAPYRMGPGAYRWFDYQEGSEVEICEAQQLSSARSLAGAVERLSCRYPERKLHLFGHSQGAMMALDLALARPELVAGCIAASGRLLPQSIVKFAGWQAVNRTRFLVAHGMEDSVVPFQRAQDTLHYLTTNGAAVTFNAYRCGHDINQAMLDDAIDWLEASR